MGKRFQMLAFTPKRFTVVQIGEIVDVAWRITGQGVLVVDTLKDNRVVFLSDDQAHEAQSRGEL